MEISVLGGHHFSKIFSFIFSDKENGYTALMFAAIEGDEIIADILVACVSHQIGDR